MPRSITSAQRDELAFEASAFLFPQSWQSFSDRHGRRESLRKMLTRLKIGRVTDATTAYQYHCLMALFTKDS
jgi:hypothetical protein